MVEKLMVNLNIAEIRLQPTQLTTEPARTALTTRRLLHEAGRRTRRTSHTVRATSNTTSMRTMTSLLQSESHEFSHKIMIKSFLVKLLNTILKFTGHISFNDVIMVKIFLVLKFYVPSNDFMLIILNFVRILIFEQVIKSYKFC